MNAKLLTSSVSPPASIDPEELIPNDEAARLLGVKPATTIAWRHENRGPAYLKIGRLVYYRRVDIAKWLAAQLCDPEAKAKSDGGSAQ